MGPAGASADGGFERARLLHGEQEFVLHGPLPRAGEARAVVPHGTGSIVTVAFRRTRQTDDVVISGEADFALS